MKIGAAYVYSPVGAYAIRRQISLYYSMFFCIFIFLVPRRRCYKDWDYVTLMTSELDGIFLLSSRYHIHAHGVWNIL